MTPLKLARAPPPPPPSPMQCGSGQELYNEHSRTLIEKVEGNKIPLKVVIPPEIAFCAINYFIIF